MNHCGQLLKLWRKHRHISQLELSLVTNISARHISFIETGRTKASKEVLLLLANGLNMPLSEQNLLLNSAGFPAVYTTNSLEDQEMLPVKNVLELILTNHQPYPALVLDWHWNIVLANSVHNKMMQVLKTANPQLIDSNNLIDLVFHQQGLRTFIQNWQQVADIMLARIQREIMLNPERSKGLMAKLKPYLSEDCLTAKVLAPQASQPMLHVDLSLGDVGLKLFSTLATFGTATDITMQELIIEQYFPVDESTQAFFHQLQDMA